jgi:hypothetical protein
MSSEYGPPSGSLVLSKKDRATVLSALDAAALWEDSLAEAWSGSKRDPAYGKAVRAASRYRLLSRKLATQQGDR